MYSQQQPPQQMNSTAQPQYAQSYNPSYSGATAPPQQPQGYSMNPGQMGIPMTSQPTQPMNVSSSASTSGSYQSPMTTFQQSQSHAVVPAQQNMITQETYFHHLQTCVTQMVQPFMELSTCLGVPMSSSAENETKKKNEQLNLENQQLKTENKQLEERNKQLEECNRVLDTKVKELESKYNGMIAIRDNFEFQLGEANKKNQELTVEMSRREHELQKETDRCNGIQRDAESLKASLSGNPLSVSVNYFMSKTANTHVQRRKHDIKDNFAFFNIVDEEYVLVVQPTHPQTKYVLIHDPRDIFNNRYICGSPKTGEKISFVLRTGYYEICSYSDTSLENLTYTPITIGNPSLPQ